MILGLANFYQQFWRACSNIAAPMNKLLQKDQEWEWKEEQQKAFDELKARFTTNPILITADLEKPLRGGVRYINFATGAVLSMKCEDDKWRPCAFYSKSLNDVERNYDVQDIEMMGVIRALEAWRHHLEGGKTQSGDMVRSSESAIFYRIKEVELQTSGMGTLPIKM